MNFARRWIKKMLAGRAPAVVPCSVCGRALRSSTSIERGMGAVCAGKHAKKDTMTLDLFEGATTGSAQ